MTACQGSLADTATVAPAGNVLQRVVHDEVMLLAPGREVLALRGPGRTLWTLLDGRRSVGAVVRATAEAYGMPVADATPVLLDLLDQLCRDGIVRPASDADTGPGVR